MEIPTRSAGDVVREAQAALENGDLERARALGVALLRVRPHDYFGKRTVLSVEVKKGNAAAATKALRGLQRLDPLDTQVLQLLLATDIDQQERESITKDLYEIEPTADNERNVRILGGGALPDLSDRAVGRLLKKAGLYHLAGMRFDYSTALTDQVEALLNWVWSDDQARVEETLKKLLELPEPPLVARLLDCVLTSVDSEQKALVKLEHLVQFDAEMQQSGRLLPEFLLAELPLQRAGQTYLLEAAEDGLRLVAQQLEEDVEEAPKPQAVVPSAGEPKAVVEAGTEMGGEDDVPEEVVAQETRVPEVKPVEVVPPLEELPADMPLPEKLAIRVAGVIGILRALVVTHEGALLANAPKAGANNIEARLIGLFIPSLLQAEEYFSDLKERPFEEIRIDAGNRSAHVLLNIIREPEPAALVFLVDGDTLDPQQLQNVLSQVLTDG